VNGKKFHQAVETLFPMALDLGYHSKVPKYEGDVPMSEHCPVLKGKCYYDGSTLNAERVFERLVNEGDAGVWAELESYYATTFQGV